MTCLCVHLINLSCVCVCARASWHVWVGVFSVCFLHRSLYTQLYHITTLCNLQNVSYVSLHIEVFFFFLRDV